MPNKIKIPFAPVDPVRQKMSKLVLMKKEQKPKMRPQQNNHTTTVPKVKVPQQKPKNPFPTQTPAANTKDEAKPQFSRAMRLKKKGVTQFVPKQKLKPPTFAAENQSEPLQNEPIKDQQNAGIDNGLDSPARVMKAKEDNRLRRARVGSMALKM